MSYRDNIKDFLKRNMNSPTVLPSRDYKMKSWMSFAQYFSRAGLEIESLAVKRLPPGSDNLDMCPGNLLGGSC